MSKFAQRRPVGYALTMWFAMFFAYLVAGAITMNLGVSSSTRTLVFGGVLSVFGLLVVAGQRWWREVGFTAVRDWRPFLVLLIMPVINLARGFHVSDLGTVAVLALGALLVGLNEELWFRGILQRALANKSIGWSVGLGAILFGVLHMLNGLAGQNLWVTLIQVVYAFVLGLCFALVRVKTQSLWPVMLAHALTDFFAWTAQSGQIGGGSVSTVFDVVLPALVVVIFGGYSAYLWRSVKAEGAVRKAA